ncbi:hypothetical protein [Luminiphilus sp. nBUS_07]|uniref:hypothetical protein n=1 Tax=Luminiphilus sp. nBUS_07 TaxID=3395314 RepID=UPI003EBF2A5D
MKSFLITLGVIATAVIWWAAVAVTQQLNAARNVEDQISALTLSERTITSPAVWGEVLGKLGKQEIDRLFEQQSSKALLIDATEKLLYNAIVEYRDTLREKQASAKTINNSLQAMGQAFILDVLVDFDALESSVPAIAEAFVEDLEQGELAADLESALSQYLKSLSVDLNAAAIDQTRSIHRLLQCETTAQCVAKLNASQQQHQEQAKLLGLCLALALLSLIVINRSAPSMNQGPYHHAR